MDSYESLIEYIFTRFPSVQGSGFNSGSYKPGLDAMRSFDKALGSPSSRIKTIHIAGTNGKGSTANMLASAFKAAGYKVGLYTSPHLLDFRERILVDGEMIPKECAETFLRNWKPYFESRGLSFFEITTGMAFHYFEKEKVDVAVIETGLGGRLDSTNIITPELSIITSIGLDHCALLGNTLEKIAAEKAGILKSGVPAVIGEWREETAPVFMEKAGGALLFAPKETPRDWDRAGEILSRMDLAAAPQRDNLRTVLTAIDLLEKEFPGLRSREKVIDGIIHTARNMHFHGRWERLSERPEVIADIGHNAHALRSNFETLEKSGRPLIIVYGIMADKDLDSIIPLMPRRARYIFVAPKGERALGARALLEKCSFPGATAAGSVREGVEMALHEAAPDTLIYIGGSTFVVAEALPLFQ